MCGRYELHSHPAAIALAFGLDQPPEIDPHYNIAPTTDVPIVRMSAEGRRELTRMRWGLVPRWAKDPSIGSHMINARGETIVDKPSFRMAYRWHRCLLPANGFYEWTTPVSSTEQTRRQPYWIGMRDAGLFALAGLSERWRSQDGTVLDTCTIVTTTANSLLTPLSDRMPVIVAPEDYERWLDPANTDVIDLIAPFPSEAMTCHPVSSRVSHVRNDDPTLIERVEPSINESIDVTPPPRIPEQESLF